MKSTRSQQYVGLLKACHEVMPILHEQVKVEYFYDEIDNIRKQFKRILDEFDGWSFYPRYNMEVYHEACDLTIEMCKKTDIDIMWIIDPEKIILCEENWQVYRKCEQIAIFYFRGINITPILLF